MSPPKKAPLKLVGGPDKIVTLPLSYALAAEAAGDSLSALLEDGLSVENVEKAWEVLYALCAAEEELSPEIRKALEIEPTEVDLLP